MQQRLIATCREALEYYLSLQSEAHRDAWVALLLLFLTRVQKMDDERVRLREERGLVVHVPRAGGGRGPRRGG